LDTDALQPDLLSLPAAARILPRNSRGKTVSIQTLRRWALRGIRGERLSLTRVGGRMYVAKSALADFLSRTNAASHHILQPSPSVAAARAINRLKKLGA
jgi:hypothetical protein